MKIRMKHNHQQERVVEPLRYDWHWAPYSFWKGRGMVDGETIIYSTEEWEPVPAKKWVPIRTMLQHPTHISIYKDGRGAARWDIPSGIRVTQCGQCHLEISEEVDA